ncbi:MAG: mercury(II) reductase [Candidatus Geothermarchaeales archaeon]
MNEDAFTRGDGVVVYDLVVIGGGAAGFAAALQAESLETKTLMINSGLPPGGTCVNVGCVPSKHLLEVGHDLFYPKTPRFSSLSPATIELDFSRTMMEKEELVAALRKSNYTDVVDEFKRTEFKEGVASFVSEEEVKVDGRNIKGRRFILATGSTTRVPPVPGLGEIEYLTNESILSLASLPDSLLVLGGGPLGLEFAQMFQHFGSKVTVLEMMDRILPMEEPEISHEIHKLLEDEGIRIHARAKAKKVVQQDGRIIVSADVGTIERSFEGERLLVATGVKAKTAGLNLERAKVAVNQMGFIHVDHELRTSNAHVFAAGDCTGTMPLETVAAKQGYVAALNALTDSQERMDYTSIPHAVFTDPQVASVGLTEEQLMEREGVCACRVIPLSKVAKALTVKDTRGILKMVVNPKTTKVVGVHVVAPGAAEIITAATYAIKMGMTVDDIIDTVHVFPTFAEVLKLAALAFRMNVDVMPCCVV